MKPNVLCIIMGGGKGNRLYPLTKSRCKPAVPLAGKYRLVDIPISNCLNSSFNKIYILTQFNTRSLHRHIEETYRFDTFGEGAIDIFSAEQTNQAIEHWYVGNADAVRKNLQYLHAKDDDIILILSGDQLYSMDLANFVNHHIRLGADITIAAKAVPEYKISAFGIMKIADDYTISEFAEKPQNIELVKDYALSPSLRSVLKDQSSTPYYLASMGIYIFNASVLKQALANTGSDFGRDIIPAMRPKTKMYGYVFDGFWEDIGTVRSFFDTNLMLTDLVPEFDFFDSSSPIYTRARYLPSCKVNSCYMERSLLADGGIITGATLKRCVIGLRAIVREGVLLENVLFFGANFYDSFDCMQNETETIPLGIGENSCIKNAIIDKNARIGKNVFMSPDGKLDGAYDNDIYVKDSILCIAKDAVIPNGTIF